MLMGQIEGAAWAGPVMVERVFRRRGEGVLPWRYRAVLRNSGPAAVLALQVNLHPPFRPSAEVLGQRLLCWRDASGGMSNWAACAANPSRPIGCVRRCGCAVLDQRAPRG